MHFWTGRMVLERPGLGYDHDASRLVWESSRRKSRYLPLNWMGFLRAWIFADWSRSMSHLRQVARRNYSRFWHYMHFIYSSSDCEWTEPWLLDIIWTSFLITRKNDDFQVMYKIAGPRISHAEKCSDKLRMKQQMVNNKQRPRLMVNKESISMQIPGIYRQYDAVPHFFPC
jgi:hypothetical protein